MTRLAARTVPQRTSDATAQERTDPPYGWVVVAGLGVTETVSYGVLYYAFAVFLTPMKADLGLSTAQLAAAFSLALAVSGLAGLAVGRWLDVHSPRALMTLGSTLAALLVISWSRVASLVELYAVFAGIGVAMAAVLYEPASIAITKWFVVRRRHALTTLTLVAALASFVFSPLSQRLVELLGWRTALVILAVILAVITVPLHALVLRTPPRPPRASDVGADSGVARLTRVSLPGFWLLSLSFALGSFVSSAVSVLLVTLLLTIATERPSRWRWRAWLASAKSPAAWFWRLWPLASRRPASRRSLRALSHCIAGARPESVGIGGPRLRGPVWCE